MKWKTKRILESGRIYLSYNVFGSIKAFADRYGGSVTVTLIHQIIGTVNQIKNNILPPRKNGGDNTIILFPQDLPRSLSEKFLMNVWSSENKNGYSINFEIREVGKAGWNKAAVVCYFFSRYEVEAIERRKMLL